MGKTTKNIVPAMLITAARLADGITGILLG